MQVLGDLLQQKKDRLRRYVQQERNLEMATDVREQLLGVAGGGAAKGVQPAQ